MPRKAKEAIENEENKINKITKKETSSIKKLANSSTSKSAKKNSVLSQGEVGENSRIPKKTANVAKPKSNKVSKTAIKPKKETTKRKTANSVKKATSVTKKKTTNSTKKNVKIRSKTVKNIATPEYYDLPYHYNQTIVKVLAQTPKTLFVYWDVSEQDRMYYEKQFGPDFFNNTIPFLRVKNETFGYSFDVDVDDFANGWYLHVNDAKCNYTIELLRKQRPYTAKVIESPIYITTSNNMETPNDHILFDINSNAVYFKNIKTNQVTSKNISRISLLRKVGKIYNIYDFYKTIYQNENVNEIFDLDNPTSGNPTSTFN